MVTLSQHLFLHVVLSVRIETNPTHCSCLQVISLRCVAMLYPPELQSTIHSKVCSLRTGLTSWICREKQGAVYVLKLLTNCYVSVLSYWSKESENRKENCSWIRGFWFTSQGQTEPQYRWKSECIVKAEVQYKLSHRLLQIVSGLKSQWPSRTLRLSAKSRCDNLLKVANKFSVYILWI